VWRAAAEGGARDEPVNGCGETLQRLMKRRGLSGPEDLARLLEGAGHPVPAREIAECMGGGGWVDGYLPGKLAEALGLDPEEMGELASAVAYGQVRTEESLRRHAERQ